mmetsp:Transcript_24591/g.32108  ORF Transcript_24591/g.32108 Transcript_24591/m.32108 type:complete len:191 (-) Transcript_24591:289-861(-)
MKGSTVNMTLAMIVLASMFVATSAFSNSFSQVSIPQPRVAPMAGSRTMLTMSRLTGSNKDMVFLEKNAQKPGVTVLASGLQYRVLEEGPAGGPSPLLFTKCLCNYEGTTIDGKVFDSSYKRGQPIEFAPYQVIKGWTEAMQMMKEGDKWELVLPSKLAYGKRQIGPDIYPGATLVFQMELVKVNPLWKFW